MVRCPEEALRDLASVLDEMRGWSGIREKSFAVFYVRSKPFLHFHLKDGRRWADVREGGDWEQVEIAPQAPPEARAAFLAEVLSRYDSLGPSSVHGSGRKR